MHDSPCSAKLAAAGCPAVVYSEQKPPPAELLAEHNVGAQYLLCNHVHVIPRLRHSQPFLQHIEGDGGSQRKDQQADDALWSAVEASVEGLRLEVRVGAKALNSHRVALAQGGCVAAHPCSKAGQASEESRHPVLGRRSPSVWLYTPQLCMLLSERHHTVGPRSHSDRWLVAPSDGGRKSLLLFVGEVRSPSTAAGSAVH